MSAQHAKNDQRSKFTNIELEVADSRKRSGLRHVGGTGADELYDVEVRGAAATPQRIAGHVLGDRQPDIRALAGIRCAATG